MSWQVSSTFKVQCLERKSRTWNYWVKLVLGDFTECWWEGVLVTNFIAFDSLCFGLGLIYILSINIFFLLFQSLCTLLFNFYFFFFFFWPHHMWDLVPWPGMEPKPPPLLSLNHWTNREVPELFVLSVLTTRIWGQFLLIIISFHHSSLNDQFLRGDFPNHLI